MRVVRIVTNDTSFLGCVVSHGKHWIKITEDNGTFSEIAMREVISIHSNEVLDRQFQEAITHKGLRIPGRDGALDAIISALASLAAAISLLEGGGRKAAPSDAMFKIMLDDYRKALKAAQDVLPPNGEIAK